MARLMARHSRSNPTQIIYDYWLIFDQLGGVRLSRGDPDIARGEQKMLFTATLPKSLWQRPQLRGTILINDAGKPNLSIDVTAAEESIRSVTGLDIDIQIINPSETK